MKKTFFISLSILLTASFLNVEAALQDTKQASLNENGKIVLVAEDLQIFS